jgi:hypothetical protein
MFFKLIKGSTLCLLLTFAMIVSLYFVPIGLYPPIITGAILVFLQSIKYSQDDKQASLELRKLNYTQKEKLYEERLKVFKAFGRLMYWYRPLLTGNDVGFFTRTRLRALKAEISDKKLKGLMVSDYEDEFKRLQDQFITETNSLKDEVHESFSRISWIFEDELVEYLTSIYEQAIQIENLDFFEAYVSTTPEFKDEISKRYKFCEQMNAEYAGQRPSGKFSIAFKKYLKHDEFK